MEMKNVFDRTALASGATRISDSRYNLIMGLVLCYGFFINWLMVKYIPYNTLENIHPFVFLIGYFASCFLGVYLFTKYDDELIERESKKLGH